MAGYRIEQHPILEPVSREMVTFTWSGQAVTAHAGEMIASALFAAGVQTFGHHHRDGAPQGIFCANGQCAQCMVLVDGRAAKACMEPVRPGMRVEPLDGLPALPHADASARPVLSAIPEVEVEVLIVGGGPAGMAAAVELGRAGVQVLLVDDKERLGGKLLLQTHRFFGSVDAVWAGTRGIDIASRLSAQVAEQSSVAVWTASTVLGVFHDGFVGVLRGGGEYTLVRPGALLVAAGAREKTLAFRGNTLPGVYGAGAFQTLVNRDLVRAAKRLFIVGGGNVGLIAGYHALQAGIGVVGLVEALPECGGYKVHKDKLIRMGVPIYTAHTIVSANGDDRVESVTIARVDERFQVIPGTEATFACDTVLIAVGLDPVDEFYRRARAFGYTVLAAGDAEEIAEASAAIFAGRIRGREAAGMLGVAVEPVPAQWRHMAAVLKSKPGAVREERLPERESGVFPVIHCLQEIPCDPCTRACPSGQIRLVGDDLRATPAYVLEGKGCTGCAECVTRCPGLAIALVDYRKDPEFPTVTLPFEFGAQAIGTGDRVVVTATTGEALGEVEVTGVRSVRRNDHTLLVRLRAPRAIAGRIAGIRVQSPLVTEPLPAPVERLIDDAVVCRCGRVTAGEIRSWIQAGVRDLNELKVVSRALMGACGGKNCGPLIQRLFREEGIALTAVTPNTERPLFVETLLGAFAGCKEES